MSFNFEDTPNSILFIGWMFGMLLTTLGTAISITLCVVKIKDKIKENKHQALSEEKKATESKPLNPWTKLFQVFCFNKVTFYLIILIFH